MKKCILLEVEDIKHIIAKEYHTDAKNVIKNQYSYIVVIEEGGDSCDQLESEN